MARQAATYPPELRERAMRIVAGVKTDYPSEGAAIGVVQSCHDQVTAARDFLNLPGLAGDLTCPECDIATAPSSSSGTRRVEARRHHRDLEPRVHSPDPRKRERRRHPLRHRRLDHDHLLGHGFRHLQGPLRHRLDRWPCPTMRLQTPAPTRALPLHSGKH